MEIRLYEQIKEDMKKYFEKQNLTKSYNADIVSYAPTKPTYPLIIFTESRNTVDDESNGYLERVASLGYRVDIYGKTNGSVAKDVVARKLASLCDDYLTNYVGLRQVSWNIVENAGQNGELYEIILMYSTQYHENKQRIL